MICRLCGLEITGERRAKQVRHPKCQLEHRHRDRRLRVQLARMRRHPEPESPEAIEATFQQALAEVKRTRPFSVEVGWQSALARLG